MRIGLRRGSHLGLSLHQGCLQLLCEGLGLGGWCCCHRRDNLPWNVFSRRGPTLGQVQSLLEMHHPSNSFFPFNLPTRSSENKNIESGERLVSWTGLCAVEARTKNSRRSQAQLALQRTFHGGDKQYIQRTLVGCSCSTKGCQRVDRRGSNLDALCDY